jgi:hypothetical protein
MTHIANIGQRDMLRRYVDIYLGEDNGNGGITAYLPNNTRKVVTEYDSTPIEPTLSLHEASARALLQALLRHFDGGEDTRSLRKDYDAERSRVDKLTDALIEIAKTPPVVIER